jgi:hypothetical protein
MAVDKIPAAKTSAVGRQGSREINQSEDRLRERGSRDLMLNDLSLANSFRSY